MFVVCLRPSGQTLAGMYKNPTPWDGKLSPPFQVYIFYSSQSWISGKHTAFWSYEMMAHHNSLSSCPYTCPRCAIKQVNQVETDFMIQKEKIDLQEVMARRPGKGLDDSSEFVCSLSLSLHAVFEVRSFLFMLSCIHPQTDRKTSTQSHQCPG